jgi:ketosteroid isomerase-like protein
MIPSTELHDLILQWYKSISSGDTLGSAERLFSHQDGLLTIGSDPTEWWEGFEAIIGAYQATASKGDLAIEVDDLQAYSEGTVGWAADRVVLKMPNGVQVHLRHTFVLHQESGEWKIVRAHYSIGVTNEATGFEAA